ncbi:RNA and export factor-binding protein 2 [Morus notabilis]|uniref:RNA and export factor-binding protein 2 n=1 Tax=Morus notabilis TaxID=981085 RepID=W9RL46_9ROSA|nr:RNA and export factor-binding protein 2 [Morus notabilis]
MQDFLDMSLDDLIAKNKKPGGYNRNANFRPKDRDRTARVAGSGPDRRFLNRLSARTTPYSLIQEKVVLSGGGSKAQEGTKLYISNLNSDVSNDDLEFPALDVTWNIFTNLSLKAQKMSLIMSLERAKTYFSNGQILFSDVGEVMQNTIHYDKNGKSKGTAEVVFVHYLDALAAIKRYDTVRLDGKPLKIELVGVNVVTPHALPPTGDGILGKPISAFKRGEVKNVIIHGEDNRRGWREFKGCLKNFFNKKSQILENESLKRKVINRAASKHESISYAKEENVEKRWERAVVVYRDWLEEGWIEISSEKLHRKTNICPLFADNNSMVS